MSQREGLPAHWQGAEASRNCLNLRVATAKIATHLRTFAIAVLILLTANAFAATKAPELQQLRDQLKKAHEAEDKPAIIELSRRMEHARADAIRNRGTRRLGAHARCVAKSNQATACSNRRFPRRALLQTR